MNSSIYPSMTKFFVAFLSFILQMQVFGQNTYYAQNGGSFTEIKNWNTSKGTFPTLAEMTDGKTFFVIQKKITITLNDKINIGGLSISNGGILEMNGAVADVTGDVTINNGGGTIVSTINFNSGNNTLLIRNLLNGGENSQITHQGDGKQELILHGKTNTLDIFNTSKSIGTSIVRYAGALQTVFNSNNYKNLYLEGSGSKVLSSLPKSILDGTTVGNVFSIINCKLYLGDFNFSYSGLQTNLKYEKGWVVTNGSGLYKNLRLESSVTFPIGDAKSMQAIRISTKDGTTQFNARFGGVEESLNEPIPNNGHGVWYVASSQFTTAIITLISPSAPSTLVSASKIAVYTNKTWLIEDETKYDSQLKEYTSDVTLNKDINSIGILTCPTFTLSSTTLPEATIGNKYYHEIQVNGPTGVIDIAPITSPNDLSIKVGKDLTKDLVFSIENPGTTNYSLAFTIRDELLCETDFNVKVNIKSSTTIWDGKNWSNGLPDITKDAIFRGNYFSIKDDSINAKTVIVEETSTVTIVNNSAIVVASSLINYGSIKIDCGGILRYNAFKGNDITDSNPVILPASLDPGIAGQDYNVYFTANDSPDNLNIEKEPTDFDFFVGKGLLKNTTPPKPQPKISFTLVYSENDCIVKKDYTFKIIDLPSPNLSIAPIGVKTVDDNAFKVALSTRSKGNITYSITPNDGCTKINSEVITPRCAGTYTVQVTQQASGLYKSQTATQTFTVSQGKGRILVRNYAFIVGENTPIKIVTKSNPATFSFDQLKGFDVATVDAVSGLVVPLKSGEFAVRVSMAATTNYTAFDSVYVFNVSSLKQPPVAIADSIVLEMGKDSTFNILLNDKGMTEVITADQTDIDTENDGIQYKFYATELGNFIIDAEGNLTVKPFNGFIGTSKIGYTVTDVNGLTSKVAYIKVTVDEPYVLPELKANEVMTPNDDNLNDALVIANTDINKENSISVFDEVGNVIFETTNYKNDWRGVNKKGKPVEPGIYFYVYEEKQSGRGLKQYIQVLR